MPYQMVRTIVGLSSLFPHSVRHRRPSIHVNYSTGRPTPPSTAGYPWCQSKVDSRKRPRGGVGKVNFVIVQWNTWFSSKVEKRKRRGSKLVTNYWSLYKILPSFDLPLSVSECIEGLTHCPMSYVPVLNLHVYWTHVFTVGVRVYGIHTYM